VNRVLGVIGGGQLARMMIPAAVNLGIDIRVLAENDDTSARLASTHIGDYTDVTTVLDFAQHCEVITFDHEHVPQDVLTALVSAGAVVRPAPEALVFAQDKIRMRARLSELGVPLPGWARATKSADVEAFLADFGAEAIAKTARGGYDGKGVRVINAAADIADWFDALAADDAILLEEKVSFRRELAQMIARRPSGETALWPVVETVQRGGVCAEVIAPAPSSAGAISDMAGDIATKIADGLGVTGVMAVELFETTDDRILVNELAMRPHNSGHWTQDGSVTSQFEQHVRAVLDFPLGSTAMPEPWAVMVNIIGGPEQDALSGRVPLAMAAHPDVKFHLYGKQPRPGRKVGHVNISGTDLDDIVAEARGASGFFQD